MKDIQMIKDISMQCNNEGHRSGRLFGSLLRNAAFTNFHENSYEKKNKPKKNEKKGEVQQRKTTITTQWDAYNLPQQGDT